MATSFLSLARLWLQEALPFLRLNEILDLCVLLFVQLRLKFIADVGKFRRPKLFKDKLFNELVPLQRGQSIQGKLVEQLSGGDVNVNNRWAGVRLTTAI